MNTNEREVLELALKALDAPNIRSVDQVILERDARASLRAALRHDAATLATAREPGAEGAEQPAGEPLQASIIDDLARQHGMDAVKHADFRAERGDDMTVSEEANYNSLHYFAQSIWELATHPTSHPSAQAEPGTAKWCKKCGEGVVPGLCRQKDVLHPSAQVVGGELPERELFEAWIARDGGDLSTFGSGSNKYYSNSAVNNAWTGWQACIRAARPAGEDTARLRDALHLIIGVTEAKDCPALDRPTEFAISQSRGMRLGTIRRLAVAARTSAADQGKDHG